MFADLSFVVLVVGFAGVFGFWVIIGFVGYVLVECGMVGSGFGELWLWGMVDWCCGWSAWL